LGEFIFGHNDVGLRIGVLLIHGAIALILMQIAKELRLPGARWAALCYLTLPAVAYSSNIASTDPPMMLGWALALWGIILARRLPLQGFALAGVGLGLSVLGKYTGFVIIGLFVLGAFLPQTRPRYLPFVIALIITAFVIMAPNLYWNWAHDFASFRHVGDNANLDGPLMNPGKMAEFVLAQFGIFGPLLMALLVPASIHAIREPLQGSSRLLLIWVWPLLLLMITQSLISRAHANWAAPVYVAASLLVVSYLLHKNWV
jgi:4-amino-4-deoxy-L-arabinose transferase and related glycosyltransferases of PMT family